MDVETYNTVLSKRGENPTEIPNDHGTGEGLSRADIAFRKDLIHKKVVWYNNQKSDWHAYIKNYHPLYSICTAPKEHPFSRPERLVVFIADLGFAAVMSIFTAGLIKSMRDPEEFYDSDTIDTDTEPSDNGLILFTQIIFSISNGLVKAIANGLLKYIAICPCCQTNACSNTCRSFCERVGHCLMCLWTCWVLFLVIIFIVLAVQWDIFAGFALNSLLTNVFGWIWSLCLLSLCFKIQKKKEKKNQKGQLSKLKVNYIDYEKMCNGKDVDVSTLEVPCATNEGEEVNNSQQTVQQPVQVVIPQTIQQQPQTVQYVVPNQQQAVIQQPQQVQYVTQPQQPPVEYASAPPNENALPHGWRSTVTPDGKVYYQNDITQEARWDKP